MTTRTGSPTPNALQITGLRELGMSLGFAGAVRAAVRLGAPDALGDEPADVAAIASAIGADTETLDRLMRALTSHGVFEEVAERVYAHTASSRLLREDAPVGVRYMVLWATAPWTWRAWPRLDEAVRSGKAVFPDIYGKEFFAYLREEDAASAEVFDRAMTQSSAITSAAVAATLDLRGVGTVADIGGGQGHLLRTLLEADPALHGVLFDLEGVVAGADPALRPGGALAGRTRIIGGDCRQGIGAGADLYIYKNVLEWDDDSTLAALRSVTDAARPGARVALVQNLVDDSPEMKVTTTMDLFLLLNVGGRKHTRRSLAGLMERAGIEPGEVRPVPDTSLHVVEGTVADAAAGTGEGS
ncbi:methyltransferase [Actinomadura graeca]|uniref:Methyltransferase n=1 Tax=Actinomadura graeca TaxID=2750812 RepID=A0ABX8QYI7_9ACTN|nr:acetylserotonin O-methyltransferase [Actinomadura graeca]QXJ21833.1 methyltransferase [Actinomadura graeca]